MKHWQWAALALLCGLLLGVSAQAQSRPHTHTMPGNRSGILYGQNYAFVLTAPKGWVLDTHSGRAEGAVAVCYPVGSSWEAARTVLYAQVVPITDPARQTLHDVMRSIIGQMRAESPRLVVRAVSPLPTASAQRAAVRELSGTPDGSRNAVAFLRGSQSVTELVLSAHTAAQFQAGWAAFKRFVASYSAFQHVSVTPPAAPAKVRNEYQLVALKVADASPAKVVWVIYDAQGAILPAGGGEVYPSLASPTLRLWVSHLPPGSMITTHLPSPNPGLSSSPPSPEPNQAVVNPDLQDFGNFCRQNRVTFLWYMVSA